MTDEESLEAWAERAAVREYNGNLVRTHAEFLAAKDYQRQYGDVPQCVRDVVEDGRKIK